VWAAFCCATLGDYHNLYNRADVLLLADVFETFCKTCLVQYGLDPAHYYTSPEPWAVMAHPAQEDWRNIRAANRLRPEVEKGMRGGISVVSKRHARANNPLVEGYYPEKPASSILYLGSQQPVWTGPRCPPQLIPSGLVVKKEWTCESQLGLTGTSAEVEKLVPGLRD
jgi:hypothetical protein